MCKEQFFHIFYKVIKKSLLIKHIKNIDKLITGEYQKFRRLFMKTDNFSLNRLNKIILIIFIIEKTIELISLIFPSLKYIKVIKWFLTFFIIILEK